VPLLSSGNKAWLKAAGSESCQLNSSCCASISTARIIIVDKHVASPTTFTSLKAEGMGSDPYELWPSPYLNHLAEHNHRISGERAQESTIRDVEKGGRMKQVAWMARLFGVAI